MSGTPYDHHEPPSPPPAPPLPPPRYGNRAASALARFAQPFIYASRPPSAQGERPSETKAVTHRNSSPTSRTTAHKTGLPINAFDISPARTHAIVAGREILKTIHVTESTCTEDFNLRASIIAYAAAHDSSGRAISARHKDQLAATDVKWSHGKYDSTVATAAANGQIVIYDLNRPGVELARLHEHTRQVHRIAFNPFQGALLLSGSQDATIRLWDLRALRREESVVTCRSTHKYPGNNEGIRDLRWSPTEGVEFAAGTDNGVVQRWDFQKPNAPLLKINAHEKTCFSIDWHPDGKHLASGGADKNLKVWDFSSTDRRMKPCWQIRAPKPVLNARWRPPCWKAEDNVPGRWSSTHIATSYDNQDPRIHVWDMRRPSVPFRELDRYDTPPSAILWHSENLLWSVGTAGNFTQSDIDFAKKSWETQCRNTVAVAPDGNFTLFLENSSRRRVSAAEVEHAFIHRNGRKGSSGEKLSSSYSATEGSLEEPSLLGTSIKARRRKAPSSWSSRSVAGTPPSLGSGGPVLPLDDTLQKANFFRPAQAAAYGSITGIFGAEAFAFLAQHYKSHVDPKPGVGDTVCQLLPEALVHNAGLAAYVGQYRLAQSWRILALALQKELESRGKRNVTSISKSAKRLSKDDRDLPQSTTNAVNAGRITPPKESRISNGAARPPRPLSVEGGSNMATPLARPVPNAFIQLPTSSSSDLDGRDTLTLPEPMFGKRSPQKPVETSSALSQLRSPEDNRSDPFSDSISPKAEASHPTNTKEAKDLPRNGSFEDVERQLSERRAAIDKYRAIPRPVLRLDDPTKTTNLDPLVPRFDRHDSNESFQMFSASTDSSRRARSMGGSFESSQASGSSGPIPERWNLARRPSNAQDHWVPSRSFDVPDTSPSYSRPNEPDSVTKQTAGATADDQHSQRSFSTTRIIHEEDTIVHDPNSDSNEPNSTTSEQPALTSSDFLPSPSDPSPLPWSATTMVRPLIDYHLHSLQDTQLPTHLILLLGPYIAHDIPPALITSILLTYHNQLVSLSLYTQAAQLRKLAFLQEHTEVAQHGTYGIASGGAWCTVCNRASKGDVVGYCNRCKQHWGDCPICDGQGPAALLLSLQEQQEKDDAAGPPHQQPPTTSTANNNNTTTNNSWTWCQYCGHGGHATCLATWWDDDPPHASEGACPTMGCLHDCVPGARRTAYLQRKAESKREKAVRGDRWVVGESGAGDEDR
ncbi:MAG: hypothetical protein L6R37_002450 [Teloschistes peruensis]|nr:MAG: hypothetical protein L6R37_002450 [Teloschistes peruensis]